MELTPDPNCKNCKGTGKIPLFTSVRDCECMQNREIKSFLDEICEINMNDDLWNNPIGGGF